MWGYRRESRVSKGCYGFGEFRWPGGVWAVPKLAPTVSGRYWATGVQLQSCPLMEGLKGGEAREGIINVR